MSGTHHRQDDWAYSERRSFRLALAVALVPVPAALLISWLLGDPPWNRRRHDQQADVPVHHSQEQPAKASGHDPGSH